MKVVLLSPSAKIPKRADEYAAGYDVFTSYGCDYQAG